LAAAETAFNRGAEYGGFHLLLGSLHDRSAKDQSGARRPSLVWTCNRSGASRASSDPAFGHGPTEALAMIGRKTQSLIAAMTTSIPNTLYSLASRGAIQNSLLEAPGRYNPCARRTVTRHRNWP
jgi:hypothetical protein